MSAKTTHLTETATIESSDKETWVVRLIQEGKGSSGYYSADLLEAYHPVFDNTVSFLNHTNDVSSRNFTEIAGRVVGETWTDKDKDGKVGIYANWRPDDDHRRKLEQYRDTLGLSIFIGGSGTYDEETDTLMVESFDGDDPFRSVDVVIAPGANGRLMVESARKMYESRVDAASKKTESVTVAEDGKETKMDQELKDAFAGLAALITPLVDAQKVKATEDAQVEADAKAVESALAQFEAAVKAVDEADLLAPQKESILAAAKRGEDVAPLIESAKAVKEAAIASLQESDEHEGLIKTTRKVESAVDLGKVFG